MLHLHHTTHASLLNYLAPRYFILFMVGLFSTILFSWASSATMNWVGTLNHPTIHFQLMQSAPTVTSTTIAETQFALTHQEPNFYQ